MKLTISLVFLLGTFLQTAFSALTPEEFSTYIEKLCFKNEDNADTLLVNGQEVPLASTLENFISLVEKIEAANSGMTLEEELFYLLRNYVYENIDFSPRGKIFNWSPMSTDYSVVKTLWERDEGKRTRLPEAEDPLTNPEKCSMFFMLSHTVMRQAMKIVGRSVERTYVNTSFNGVQRANGESLDDLYPQEQGVVAVKGTDKAISLSRVLTGLYVGLKRESDRKIPLDALKKITNYNPNVDQVDVLYALTLAEVLVIAQWPFEEGKRDQLAPNGEWEASPSMQTIHDTKEVCPSVYKLPEETASMYSFSSVRGAADGLILGQIIDDLNQQRANTRLSQVLRMYYSPRGITTQQGNSLGSVSFCARKFLIDSVENTLKDQMELFALLVSLNPPEVKDTMMEAWEYYMKLKNDIYGERQVLEEMCPSQNPNALGQKYPLETPLDILVVLDSSDSLSKQQLIVGHLVNKLELRSGGGTITIFIDQREGTSGLVLKTVVNETYNVACAACLGTQKIQESSGAEKDIVIQSIDEYLQKRKKKEENMNGVKGKVVLYFNQANDERENYRLSKALKSFLLTHRDVAIYALGKETAVLKKYVGDSIHRVISTADLPDIVAQNLYEKLIKDPATLQYTDCVNARGEGGATFEEYVSPYVAQHWAMPAKYFLKSFGIKVTFEAEYGHLQACYSRASPDPQNQIWNCKNTTVNDKKLEFKDTNPCEGFSVATCAPLYFSVMGLNNTEGTFQYCQDTTTIKCKTLDQVKFKVSHEGIRCSGAFGLLSSPVLLVLAVLVIQLFTKKV